MRTDDAAMRPPAGRWVRSATTTVTDSNGMPVERWIPRPGIPSLPILSMATPFGSGPNDYPAITDAGAAAYVTAGRIAIAHALQLIGLRPGDRVLVPAYHCPAMVEPVKWMGAEPLFYRLNDDLTINFADVERRTDNRTRAMLCVHFFGFPQNPMAARAFCDSHGLVMIEDCSHSYFGYAGDRPLGAFGHYAIGSLTKFFPVREGGCLVAPPDKVEDVKARLRGQGWTQGAIAVMDAIEDAVDYGRLRGLSPVVWTMSRAKRAVLGRHFAARPNNPSQVRSGKLGEFDSSWIDTRMVLPSLAITWATSRRRLVARRRAHYRRLVQAFAGVSGVRALIPDLPEGAVPYMFPLWVDDLDRVFPKLEDLAVPMQRFGQFLSPEITAETFPTSFAFSHNVIQLACHQELTDDEVDSIVALVLQAIAS
ncbi:MAG TPA: aminotransferase class I/II-fold pyridoxal phosphate-dependent enzyme [Bradyrhizobium sp.]|nr:aminotransferase class I/II-fold pyridoxal phosphate-dependent enzyme [Bradyrhizobium sp.]